jgi:hypothetical protein
LGFNDGNKSSGLLRKSFMFPFSKVKVRMYQPIKNQFDFYPFSDWLEFLSIAVGLSKKSRCCSGGLVIRRDGSFLIANQL